MRDCGSNRENSSREINDLVPRSRWMGAEMSVHFRKIASFGVLRAVGTGISAMDGNPASSSGCRGDVALKGAMSHQAGGRIKLVARLPVSPVRRT